MRVIVMGGHEWERALLRHVLINLGFAAREVRNGEEALVRHLEEPCDLLILNACAYADEVLRTVVAMRAHASPMKLISLQEQTAALPALRTVFERIGDHPILLKPFSVDLLWQLLLALPCDHSEATPTQAPHGFLRSQDDCDRVSS